MATQRTITAFNMELASDANFDADNILSIDYFNILKYQLLELQAEVEDIRNDLQAMYDALLQEIASLRDGEDGIGDLFDQLNTMSDTVQSLAAMSEVLGLAGAAAAAAAGGGAAATSVAGLAGAGGAIGVLAAGILGAAILGGLIMGAGNLGGTEQEVANTLSEMKTTLDALTIGAEGSLSLQQQINDVKARLDWETLPYEYFRGAFLDLYDQVYFFANEVLLLQQGASDQSTLIGQINNSLMGVDLNVQELRYDFTQEQANIAANTSAVQVLDTQVELNRVAIEAINEHPLADIYSVAPIQDDVTALLARVSLLEQYIVYLACPVGSIVIIAKNAGSVPAGWLLCNGYTFSAETYPLLYAFLGTTAVPDYRGYFLRGLDNTGLVDPDGVGRTIGSIYADSIKAHTHTYYDVYAAENWSGITYQNVLGLYGNDGDNEFRYRLSDGNTGNALDPLNILQTGSTGANETRPKNKAVNYIIRAY